MKKLKLTILLLLTLAMTHLMAQQMPPVPIDPKVRYGKLDNGMTYYIRHNQQPKGRAEFYIAQNVGATLENDDQNGLAHFLEHMAFNGTKNFPGKGIINYFESIGVKFGANINAYTSLDETVYNLSDVPTARESVVDSALLVLHDWSSFILLEGDEIDAERGVIREEWRTGAGAERRMWKAANFQKYPGSQYAKRDVIGDTAVINNFTHQTLRDFYNKWYRPDLQAILIVGDVDVDKVEAKIKAMFADIPAKANAGERPIFPIAKNVEPIVAFVTDAEARFTRIELEYKHDKMPDELKLSMAGYAQGLVNNLVSAMMSERFQEITQQANAPFVAGFAFYGELVKSTDAFKMIAIPHEGREAEGLMALLLEAEKVKRFGFTASELERAKTNLLAQLEKAYNDRDNQKNNALVEEYVRHYLDAEPIPGIEWEYQTAKALLPQLKAEMINQAAMRYVTDENLIVSFMSPDKAGVKIPSKDEVIAKIAASKVAELTAKVEEDINKPLVDKAPKAGKIKKTSKNAAYGTTEWILSNGVKVVFKPTTFKQDEILLSAFSAGGTSNVKNVADKYSAALAASIVSNNGLGAFNSVDLGKVLTGKTASVTPYIETYSEGFSGNSSVKDFETMLQLIYLNFTAPRKDDNAFEAMMNMYRASLANSATDPRVAFRDTINTMISNRHPRSLILTLDALSQVNQDRALAIFKERFAAPSDFTFVFTGNVDIENPAVKQAILTYLGGLKSKKVNEKYTDHKIRVPRGIVNNHFEKQMQINKASNFIYYSGSMDYTQNNRTLMTAIGNILSMRYLESIREKEGGSYGVGVRGSLAKTPVAQASLLMQFDTDPDKQARLMAIIHDEVNEIVNNGPRADDLQKVKENMLKKYEEDIDENRWWLGSVVRLYQENIDMLKDYKASVDALSAESVQKALRSLTQQGNVLEVVMMPAQ